ncbi:hypothetical protein KSP40_PGU021452 [Platanthera guangdongensis]|uniref:Uncharacterized protein n=1 Tax=Platanthera guangdongensis TaxID=2320717 RepID=A0ABR2N4H2_9ASPA
MKKRSGSFSLKNNNAGRLAMILFSTTAMACYKRRHRLGYLVRPLAMARSVSRSPPSRRRRSPSPVIYRYNNSSRRSRRDRSRSPYAYRPSEVCFRGFENRRAPHSSTSSSTPSGNQLALRLLPHGHPDLTIFHSIRDACLLQMVIENLISIHSRKRSVTTDWVVEIEIEGVGPLHGEEIKVADSLDFISHKNRAIDEFCNFCSRRRSPSPSPRWRKSRSPSPRRRKSRSPSPRRYRRQRSRSITRSPIYKSPSPSVPTVDHTNLIEKLRKEEEVKKSNRSKGIGNRDWIVVDDLRPKHRREKDNEREATEPSVDGVVGGLEWFLDSSNLEFRHPGTEVLHSGNVPGGWF